jgi:uncharacterized protein (TIGR03118 family)
VQTPAGFLNDNDMGDDDHGGNDSRNGGKGNDDNRSFILVGNFGDGHINVFGLDGSYFGQLQNHNKKTIVIDGLWALSFAPTTSTIDTTRLYFTAGPNAEADGLFGYLMRQQ